MEQTTAHSYFKKKTNEYIQDSLFDKFDIKEQIEKNKQIQRCLSDNYLYNLIGDSKVRRKSKLKMSLEDIAELEYETGCGRIIQLKDEFVVNQIIGEGSFGIVIDALEKQSKMQVAIKILPVSKTSYEEVKTHMKIKHENITEFYRFFDNGQYLFIVMELMRGGSLRDLIRERYKKEEYFLTEEEASTIMRGIINGIHYLHSLNLSHRDIKPENIMFRDKDKLDNVKLLDLGLAIELEEYFDKTRCGTLIYMAPEQLAGKGYSKTVDIWAAGMILYILCSGGKHPTYFKKHDIDGYIKMMESFNKWEFTSNFPILARNLFLKMCRFDKNNRIETYKMNIHAWLTRSAEHPLPLTRLESWKKRSAITEFKEVYIFTF